MGYVGRSGSSGSFFGMPETVVTIYFSLKPEHTNLLPFLYSNYLNLVVSIRISYILCASNDEEPEFEDPDESFEVLTDMSEKIRKRKNLTKQ